MLAALSACSAGQVVGAVDPFASFGVVWDCKLDEVVGATTTAFEFKPCMTDEDDSSTEFVDQWTAECLAVVTDAGMGGGCYGRCTPDNFNPCEE